VLQKDGLPTHCPPPKKDKSGPFKATYDYYGNIFSAVFGVLDDVDPVDRDAEGRLACVLASDVEES
jgi:hypothetical protein